MSDFVFVLWLLFVPFVLFVFVCWATAVELGVISIAIIGFGLSIRNNKKDEFVTAIKNKQKNQKNNKQTQQQRKQNK